MKKRHDKPPVAKLKRIDCNLTEEMVRVLKSFMRAEAIKRSKYPDVAVPHGIGATIESLLRSHPAIEAARMACKANWKPRPIKGKRAKKKQS